MSVMAPKLKRKSWMNNDDLTRANEAEQIREEKPMTKRRKSTTKPAQADPSLTARESDGETPKDNAASNEALSDLEYMRRRMRHKVAGGEGPSPAFEQSDSDSSDSEGDQDQDQDDEEDDEDDERDKEKGGRGGGTQ